jgi:hypothetical protein
MLSAVNFGPMTIGSVACGPDATVLLAALDDEPAEPAPARIELAGARLVRVVTVASVVGVVDLALEDVVDALERGELGALMLEQDAKLSKSCSCG